uniref:NDUFB10 n=1 Tax=Euglena gracilis TaxID=3039 RepID=UPI002FE4FB33|eukprot:EG_transcript_29565
MGQHFGKLGWDADDVYKVTTFEKHNYTVEEPRTPAFKAPRRPFPICDRPPMPDQEGLYETHADLYEMKRWVMWEWSVYCKELSLVREELKWCVAREGSNAHRECHDLARQYTDMTRKLKMEERFSWLNHFKKPLVKDVLFDLKQ